MSTNVKKIRFLVIFDTCDVRYNWSISLLPPIVREGTPGRHEPPVCRHEPPRVARQTKPQLFRNEHAQHIKSVCVIQEVFLYLCFKFK